MASPVSGNATTKITNIGEQTSIFSEGSPYHYVECAVEKWHKEMKKLPNGEQRDLCSLVIEKMSVNVLMHLLVLQRNGKAKESSLQRAAKIAIAKLDAMAEKYCTTKQNESSLQKDLQKHGESIDRSLQEELPVLSFPLGSSHRQKSSSLWEEMLQEQQTSSHRRLEASSKQTAVEDALRDIAEAKVVRTIEQHLTKPKAFGFELAYESAKAEIFQESQSPMRDRVFSIGSQFVIAQTIETSRSAINAALSLAGLSLSGGTVFWTVVGAHAVAKIAKEIEPSIQRASESSVGQEHDVPADLAGECLTLSESARLAAVAMRTVQKPSETLNLAGQKLTAAAAAICDELGITDENVIKAVLGKK